MNSMTAINRAVFLSESARNSTNNDEEFDSQSYSSSTNGHNNKNDANGSTSSSSGGQEVKALVQKETWAVNGLRVIVLSVLVVAAVVIAWVVYDAFRKTEYDAFLEEYEAISTRMVDLFRNDILQKLWVGQGIASATRAMIEANQLQAPNMTIPSFPELVHASIKLAPVAHVKWAPLIMDENSHAFAGNISCPVWQVAPDFGEGDNARFYDLMTDPNFQEALQVMIHTRGPVMTQVYHLDKGEESEDKSESEDDEDQDRFRGRHHRNRRHLDSDSDEDSDDVSGDGIERAMSMLFPVFTTDIVDNDDNNREEDHLVGTLVLDFVWSDFLSGFLLVDVAAGEALDYVENIFDTDEVDVVMDNTCGQSFTLKVDESSFVIVAEGDLHDPSFDHLVLATTFEEWDADYTSFALGREGQEVPAERFEGQCLYRFRVYPTQELVEEHATNKPLVFAFAVAAIFVFTSAIFLGYDCIVARRQRIITERAIQTNAIVSSLFPEAVRHRVMGKEKEKGRMGGKNDQFKVTGGIPSAYSDTDPIADFFPACTVIFADIAGFTAWSSEREPTQVFKLLERIYRDFDLVAKKLGVFKVETIGDCYVAVVGVPDPRRDHAVVCAQFAKSILHQMKVVCHGLEKSLGPSTADLDVRIGIHSGSCTAGVLRGEKSRFQLFGDTMNTCARIESSGKPGMIHVSDTTAKLLMEAGKEKWLIPRDDTPELKGKGKMKSYWLHTKDFTIETASTAGSDGQDMNSNLRSLRTRNNKIESDKKRRLVEWNAEVLSKLLQKVVASRCTRGQASRYQSSTSGKNLLEHTGNMLEEVQDVLPLPQFDAKTSSKKVSSDSINLSNEVVAQLTSFIGKIASHYHDENPFHNWEHAAHVTMSVSKLLSRIVSPTDMLSQTGKTEKSAADMHDHTFGITSSPLTQFSVVLSALIHDVDHPGVTNVVLASENDPMAIKYKSRSVAEQNSVDRTFQLLMDPEFKDLRSCIFTNDDEFNLFRNTIITLVLATDIMDKELGAERKARWANVFSEKTPQNANEEADRAGVNRKATIVLEHLIQASDVAHTMQHWHVYKKWNERLFCEMFAAYKAGRLDKDPSESWYEGEIGFFDFYVIPLARKLETCGVFGSASHEYLAYAEENRQEWVVKGEMLVQGYLERINNSPAPMVARKSASNFHHTLEAPLEHTDFTAAVQRIEVGPTPKEELWC